MVDNKYYAIISGVSAATASFFGKLPSLVEETSPAVIILNDFIPLLHVERTVWIIRAISIILMILCNALVWNFFVKAMHGRGGSLVATLISASSNYCCSAFLGCFVFGETTTVLWWLGTVIVLGGLVLILLDEKSEEEDKTNRLENKKK